MLVRWSASPAWPGEALHYQPQSPHIHHTWSMHYFISCLHRVWEHIDLGHSQVDEFGGASHHSSICSLLLMAWPHNYHTSSHYCKHSLITGCSAAQNLSTLHCTTSIAGGWICTTLLEIPGVYLSVVLVSEIEKNISVVADSLPLSLPLSESVSEFIKS